MYVVKTCSCSYQQEAQLSLRMTFEGINVSNSFQALGSLPDNVEDSWSAIRTIILQFAPDTLPVANKAK